MEIARDTVVEIHYTLTDNDGEVIDSSIGGEPLAFLHGANNIIPGLENALTGKKAGDQLVVKVAAEEGYGPYVPEMIQVVPREAFQGIDEIEVGMVFNAQSDSGATVQVVVKDVTEDQVTVDGNHPLAGQDLNFDVTVASVRAASQEELDHGHVHNGHHHH